MFGSLLTDSHKVLSNAISIAKSVFLCIWSFTLFQYKLRGSLLVCSKCLHGVKKSLKLLIYKGFRLSFFTLSRIVSDTLTARIIPTMEFIDNKRSAKNYLDTPNNLKILILLLNLITGDGNIGFFQFLMFVH